MMTGQTTFGTAYAALLVAGVAAAIVGGVVLRLGLFPRRTGDARRCRRCEYIVDGLPAGAERCPECGLPLAETGNVVVGGRRRRPKVAALGAVVTLAGLAAAGLSLSERFRGVDWYAHLPARWVINDLNSPDAGRRARAWGVVKGRLAQGELSDDQQAALDAALARSVAGGTAAEPGAMRDRLVGRFARLTPAERGLVLDAIFADVRAGGAEGAERGAARLEALAAGGALSEAEDGRVTDFATEVQAGLSGGRYEWQERVVKLVGDRAAAGTLSAARRERFFAIGAPAVLRARRDVIAGERLPYVIDMQGHGPLDGWETETRRLGAWVDGGTAEGAGGGGEKRGFPSSTLGASIAVGTPGEHVLHAAVEVAAYRVTGGRRAAAPVWAHRYELSAPFRALPTSAARDYLRRRREPELAGAVRRVVSVEDVIFSRREPGHARVTVRVERPVVGVAFDVIVRRADGTELTVGSVTCAAAETVYTSLGTLDSYHTSRSSSDGTERVDVVLRGNDNVARASVDVYERWDGDLVFDGLTAAVQQGSPLPPTIQKRTGRGQGPFQTGNLAVVPDPRPSTARWPRGSDDRPSGRAGV